MQDCKEWWAPWEIAMYWKKSVYRHIAIPIVTSSYNYIVNIRLLAIYVAT